MPALLDGLNAAGDRFLEHALIFALIRIGDRPNTLKGLQIASSPVKRGALIALDQMDGGRLTPDVVTPFLAPSDPLMQQTALWVIAHHGDWGPAMIDFFRQWLARQDMDDARRDELKRQLLAFAQDAAVQELIAATLADSRHAAAKRAAAAGSDGPGADREIAGRPGTTLCDRRWPTPTSDRASGRGHAAGVAAGQAAVVSRIDLADQFPETDKTFRRHAALGKLLRALARA